MDQLAHQNKGKKDWRNRVFHLRSQSVAQQIKRTELEKKMQENKISKVIKP